MYRGEEIVINYGNVMNISQCVRVLATSMKSISSHTLCFDLMNGNDNKPN